MARKEPNPALAAELRALRELTGITQTELATWIGRTSATISNWEAGRYPIPDDAVIAYRRAVAELHTQRTANFLAATSKENA